MIFHQQMIHLVLHHIGCHHSRMLYDVDCSSNVHPMYVIIPIPSSSTDTIQQKIHMLSVHGVLKVHMMHQYGYVYVNISMMQVFGEKMQPIHGDVILTYHIDFLD